MKIAFNLKSDSITLTVHDQTFTSGNNNLPDTYSPIILFGKSDHIIDVPSFAIRDLSVGNHEKFVFPLNQNKGTVVYDIHSEPFGEVTNPEWLVDDAYHWRYKTSFKSKSVAGANYNPEKKEIYYFNGDSLSIYDVRSGESSIKVFQEKCPVKLIWEQASSMPHMTSSTLRNLLRPTQRYVYWPEHCQPGSECLPMDSRERATTGESAASSRRFFNPSAVNTRSSEALEKCGTQKLSLDLNRKVWDTLAGFSGDFLSTSLQCHEIS